MSTPPAAPVEGVSRLVAVVATVGAVVLAGGLTATTRGEAAQDVATVVSAAAPGAVVVSRTGSVPAVEGTEVPSGAVLRTSSGTAVLATGARTVTLAPASAVTVLDGVRQRLERGSALVDVASGAAVQVGVPDVARVDVPAGALIRLESLPLLRVAAYRGQADVRPAGRRSTTQVDLLHQVRVPAGALPGRVVPLALLAGDAWEKNRLSSLVQNDAELRGLAADLSAQGGPVLAALPAGLRSGRTAAGLGELSLARALASDGDRIRDDVFGELREGRSLGGSWAVVARLAGTSVQNATDYIDGLMPAEVLTEALASAPTTATVVLPFAPLPPAAPADRPTAPDGPGTPTAPRPSPTPGSTPAPLPPGVPGVLDGILETVEELLPTPPVLQAPQPRPSRTPLVRLDLPLVELDLG